MFSAALFDLDGTLVDNMRFHFAAWRTVAHDHGIALDDARIQSEFAGKKNSEIIPALLGRLVSADELITIGDRKEALYRSLYAGNVALVPGAKAYLTYLRGRRIKLALASSAPPENRTFVLAALKLEHMFDAIVGGEEVARGKPAPDIFLRAAERVSVLPAHCIVFEDAVMGVQGAVAAGARAIGVTTVECDEALRAAGAVVTIPDFLDVPDW